MGSQKIHHNYPAPGCVKRKQLGLGLKTWICLHCDDFAQMAPGLGNTSEEEAQGSGTQIVVCKG